MRPIALVMNETIILTSGNSSGCNSSWPTITRDIYYQTNLTRPGRTISWTYPGSETIYCVFPPIIIMMSTVITISWTNIIGSGHGIVINSYQTDDLDIDFLIQNYLSQVDPFWFFE